MMTTSKLQPQPAYKEIAMDIEKVPEVKRFDPYYKDDFGNKIEAMLWPDTFGDVVRYEDYESACEDLQGKLKRTQDDVDRLKEQVRSIADDLGCQEEEGHRHHHGRCIFFALHKLQDDYDKALADKAQLQSRAEAAEAFIQAERLKSRLMGLEDGMSASESEIATLTARVEAAESRIGELTKRQETLIGTFCKRCERGDKLYVEPSTKFYTHTLGGNYCAAHKLHSLLDTEAGRQARATLAAAGLDTVGYA